MLGRSGRDLGRLGDFLVGCVVDDLHVFLMMQM